MSYARGREENASTREVVQSLGREVKEEFANLDQRLDGLLRMFSKMPQASLSKDFPPRSTLEPILMRAIIIPHASTSQENEEQHELGHEVQVR